MAADDQDLTIPAFLRLSPSERPQRMRCLTPMVSLGALAAARERYEARFGTAPDERHFLSPRRSHSVSHAPPSDRDLRYLSLQTRSVSRFYGALVTAATLRRRTFALLVTDCGVTGYPASRLRIARLRRRVP